MEALERRAWDDRGLKVHGISRTRTMGTRIHNTADRTERATGTTVRLAVGDGNGPNRSSVKIETRVAEDGVTAPPEARACAQILVRDMVSG